MEYTTYLEPRAHRTKLVTRLLPEDRSPAIDGILFINLTMHFVSDDIGPHVVDGGILLVQKYMFSASH